MTTVNQCEAYAAEYQARGTAPDISIERATALMSISQSWTTLAGQLDRLAHRITDADAAGGLDQPPCRLVDPQRGLTPVAVPRTAASATDAERPDQRSQC